MHKHQDIILGISTGHGDSSAALIVNGKLVAAAEEERFTRIKHYALFPERAIRYCLEHTEVNARDVHTVALARKPFNFWWRRAWFWWNHPSLFVKPSQPKGTSLSSHLKNLELQNAHIRRVEHHFAHLMTAHLLNPEEEMALLSFDGLGDFVSATAARSHKEGIEILDRVFFPHSIGFFYTALTHYLGFPHFGDEYKVMGLSALGKPKQIEAMRQLIRPNPSSFGFTLNLQAFPILERAIRFRIERAQPVIEPFYRTSVLTALLGTPPRKPQDLLLEPHADLAASTQLCFEELSNHLLHQLAKRIPSKALGLAGGCAHNSLWVGKIPTQTPFEKIFVAPASHDAGIAVGAAAAVYNGTITVEGGHWGLLGPSPEEGFPAHNSLDTHGIIQTVFHDDKSLIQWMVDQLCDGNIVGLCLGRMEFGPRALGNRSILADPRDPQMKDKLNQRIKHRETFRPFAASVLYEHQGEWFSNPFYSPFMEAVFEVKKPKKIPAVTHFDNTCRIQSVTQEFQPFYWKLIDAFYRKTGVPMLLNTSFNDSEPVVCSSQDAFRCFTHSEIDCLVIGFHAYSKREQKKILKAA